MTLDRDPPRLLDPGSASDPLLREVLGSVRSSAPGAAQLNALAAKVHGAVTAGTAGGAASTAARALWTKAGALKLSAALLAAGGLAWWAAKPDGAQRPAPVPAPRIAAPTGAVETPASSVAEAAAPARARDALPARPAEPSRAADEGRTAPRPAPSAQRESARGSVAGPSPRAGRADPVGALPRGATPPSAAAVSDSLAPAAVTRSEPTAVPPAPVTSELALLARAQATLARDPDATLEILAEHARVHPRGQYAQERDALAIDALRRLGRRSEMQRRARDFLREHPSSPHGERIEAWMR